MGLDMYLHATKVVTDPDTVASIDKIVARLPRFDYDEEGSYYLPMWNHTPADVKTLGQELVVLLGLAPLMGEDSVSITVDVDGDSRKCTLTVAYWRKANQIHGWFVDECQGGLDECQESDPIHPEKLMQLISLCQRAVETKDPTILEPRSGFFFGSTDVDEWYWADLNRTITELTRILQAAATLGGNITFTYQSSW